MCFRIDTIHTLCGHYSMFMVACNHTSQCSSTDYPNSDGFRFPVQVIEVIRAQDIVNRCRECRINHLILNTSEPQNDELIQALIGDAESEDRYRRETDSTVHLPDTSSQPQDDPAAVISSRVRRWREERLPLEGFEDYDEENDRAMHDVLLREMIHALNDEDSLDDSLAPTEYRFQEEDGDNPIPSSTFRDHYPFNVWRQDVIAREDLLAWEETLAQEDILAQGDTSEEEDTLAQEDALARENIHTLLNELPLVDLAAMPVEDRRCGICLQPYLATKQKVSWKPESGR